MKKTLIISMAILSAMACSKENATTETVKEHRLVPMTFTAQIEDNEVSKAVFDGIKTVWEIGDQISVSKSIPDVKVTDAPVLTAQTAGAGTTFTGTAPEGLETYCAVYPASTITNWNNSATSGGYNAATAKLTTEDVQKVNTVDGVDIYIDPKYMILGGTAGKDLNFTFKHILSYIKFTIPDGYGTKLKTVTVNNANLTTNPTASTGTTNIAGTINMNGNKNWEVGFPAGAKSIAMKFTNGTGSNVNLVPGTYYIVVAPKKYDRLTFNFMNSGGKHVYFSKDGGEEGLVLKAGTVYSIGTLPEMTF